MFSLAQLLSTHTNCRTLSDLCKTPLSNATWLTACCTLQTWASSKIRSLSKGRIDDPSVLLDVLMDTPSNGEVVEGCLVNIERNGDVSAFATEFIRYAANQHLPATVLFVCS